MVFQNVLSVSSSVSSLSYNFSVFCCCGCQLFSSPSAPAWLTDTEALLPEPHPVALPEAILLPVIGAAAFLMSHLDPVPVPIFSLETTPIFAPSFNRGLFYFFLPLLSALQFSLIIVLANSLFYCLLFMSM